MTAEQIGNALAARVREYRMKRRRHMIAGMIAKNHAQLGHLTAAQIEFAFYGHNEAFPSEPNTEFVKEFLLKSVNARR